MLYVSIPRHIAADGPINPGFWYVDRDGNLWHKCPECKKGSVMQGHSVSTDGKVVPSIACFEPCTYHVFGTLENWDYGVKSAGKSVTFTEETCPGHVASDGDAKVCAHCGTHIDSMRPLEDELSEHPQ